MLCLEVVRARIALIDSGQGLDGLECWCLGFIDS